MMVEPKSSSPQDKAHIDRTAKTTKTKSDASNSNANQEENVNFRKPTLTNKERARKARQRKKKYYDDLEKRAEYLEKKVISLNSELDYCKRKLKVYESEGKSVCENNERPIQNCLMND